MTMQKKRLSWGLMVFLCLMIVGGVFISIGYAGSPKKLDSSISGPQVIVNPEAIRLGVAKLMATNIVFEGSGFEAKAGDSVLITLAGPNETKVIAAEAPIQSDGKFKTTVPALTKVMEFLKGDITFNEKFQNVVVISQPPIPKGVYTGRAESMISKQTAETKLTVKGPTIIDSLKDWIGKLTGKIQHKKTK